MPIHSTTAKARQPGLDFSKKKPQNAKIIKIKVCIQSISVIFHRQSFHSRVREIVVSLIIKISLRT